VKKASLFLCFCLFSLAASAEPVNLFIMAGQSNMRGDKGVAAGYPKNDTLDKTIALYWKVPPVDGSLLGFGENKTEWTYMQPQEGLFGPEVSFARSAAKDMPEVGVFKYSLGGTSLYSDWGAPGARGMYDDMISAYLDSTKKLRLLGHKVRVKGFIWVQGESDAETTEMSRQYYFRLKTIIRNIRELTGIEHLPVVLSVDEQHPWMKKNDKVLRAQHRIASEDRCVIFVSMLGMQKADETHLTPAGLIVHGKRLYEAWRKLSRKPECS
jgi:hypothetical protein